MPSWIQNIITVIDYDTELAMNGLDFKSYKNVIEALTDMGLIEEAKVLTAFEMTLHKKIQIFTIIILL